MGPNTRGDNNNNRAKPRKSCLRRTEKCRRCRLRFTKSEGNFTCRKCKTLRALRDAFALEFYTERPEKLAPVGYGLHVGGGLVPLFVAALTFMLLLSLAALLCSSGVMANVCSTSGYCPARNAATVTTAAASNATCAANDTDTTEPPSSDTSSLFVTLFG